MRALRLYWSLAMISQRTADGPNFATSWSVTFWPAMRMPLHLFTVTANLRPPRSRTGHSAETTQDGQQHRAVTVLTHSWCPENSQICTTAQLGGANHPSRVAGLAHRTGTGCRRRRGRTASTPAHPRQTAAPCCRPPGITHMLYACRWAQP